MRPPLPPLLFAAALACSTRAPSAPAEEPMTRPAAPPEPVTLALDGWTCTVEAGDFDNERTQTCRSGDATVELVRWWGMPETPGEPMVIANKRPVTVAGQERELIRTSMFEGESAEVDVVFFNGDGWSARLACKGCDAAQLATVLAGVRVTAG